MTESTGPLDSTESDTWSLVAIRALCATLERRSIDRLANVRDDREQLVALVRFLALAGEVVRGDATLERALACLEDSGVEPVAMTASAEDSGEDNCPFPWVWDPVREACVLPS